MYKIGMCAVAWLFLFFTNYDFNTVYIGIALLKNLHPIAVSDCLLQAVLLALGV
jgi:hypothetical protein